MSELSENLSEFNWSAYYHAVENRPPRPTLLDALKRFELKTINRTYFAVDLGCGEGRDTVELLRRGWRVLGIDAEAEAISRLMSREEANSDFLTTRVCQFEEIEIPPNVDLINASFSLPFCSPEAFPGLWQKIVIALHPGGRFCGHLFGNDDSWAINSSMNFHTRKQVELLLKPFDVEKLEEENKPGKTALGEVKHWHIFHIVACKKS
jgi:SAM-dependent methyltransferase